MSTDPKETEVLSHYKTELSVKLHPEEEHDYAKRLAAIEGEMAQHDEHAKSVKADLGAKKAKLASERSTVALKIRTGMEPRQVACTITAHFATNKAITTRDDNGEVIDQRPLSEKERQAALKFDDARSIASDLLSGAKERPEPVLGAEGCTAATLAGICTVHGSACPNPETIEARQASAKRKMKFIDVQEPKTTPPEDPEEKAEE